MILAQIQQSFVKFALSKVRPALDHHPGRFAGSMGINNMKPLE